MKRVLMLLGMAAVTAAGTIATQAFAQNLPPLERRAVVVSDVIRGDSGAGDYFVEERGALPPRAIAALLDEEGFSLLSPPIRRGPAYVAAVIDPNGNDGRVTLDAFSGRIIRFRPVMGPNAMLLPDDIRDGYARRDLAPPRNIPYVAPRHPGRQPLPRAAVNRMPPQAAVSPKNAPPVRAPAKPGVQTAASQQAAPAIPAPGKPPVAVQPTQPMPPAMGFD